MACGVVLIPDYLDERMERDLDIMRDSLPESDRPIFESERSEYKQIIINYIADNGGYPTTLGVQKKTQQLEAN